MWQAGNLPPTGPSSWSARPPWRALAGSPQRPFPSPIHSVTWDNRPWREPVQPPMAKSAARPEFSAHSHWSQNQRPPGMVHHQDRLPNGSQQWPSGCRRFGKQPADLGILVGVAGFEPAASSSRTKRAAKLRHTPVTDERSRPGFARTTVSLADRDGFPRRPHSPGATVSHGGESGGHQGQQRGLGWAAEASRCPG